MHKTKRDANFGENGECIWPNSYPPMLSRPMHNMNNCHQNSHIYDGTLKQKEVNTRAK